MKTTRGKQDFKEKRGSDECRLVKEEEKAVSFSRLNQIQQDVFDTNMNNSSTTESVWVMWVLLTLMVVCVTPWWHGWQTTGFIITGCVPLNMIPKISVSSKKYHNLVFPFLSGPTQIFRLHSPPAERTFHSETIFPFKWSRDETVWGTRKWKCKQIEHLIKTFLYQIPPVCYLNKNRFVCKILTLKLSVLG